MAAKRSSKVKETLSLTNEEIQSLLRPFGEDKADFEAAVTLVLTEAQWESRMSMKEAVAYMGFNPIKVIKEFIKRSKEGERGPEFTVRTPGGIEFKLYSGPDAPTDLLFLIVVFLERGNNVAKILLKCEPEVAEAIRRKCSAYGISTTGKIPATNLSASSITLSRLAQAFCPVTASIIIKSNLETDFRSRLYYGVILPLLMTHTIFSGVIRSADIDLIRIAKILNVEMSIMFASPKDKRKMENTVLSDLISQSENYVNAAVHSTIIDDAIKFKILTSAGILEDNDTFSNVVVVIIHLSGVIESRSNFTYLEVCKQMRALSDQPPKAT